ncbi:GNAT family N-acetyltransferase [Martelella alba]|uniref:GNAT family N-acetyltransferase n=1 Tax=Martelella alba TaxID=2590451 RepID=A0A506UGN7_9HYPH|nr:GNAT family protein [Martelella alba]TPW32504.1 GNAT family N-acetyltransferase [Martelella alba]
MTDLKDFAPRLRPQPITQRGLHVTLTPWHGPDHAEGLWQALGGSPEAVNTLLRYFPAHDFRNASDFHDWLDGHNSAGDWITRVFKRAGSEEIVGMASYMRIDPKNGSIEVGSVAHGLAMKRSAMATEAHYLMAHHIFDDLGYRRYEWKCHNENQPSSAAAKRLGFSFEGVFRQHMISRGENRDTAWFSIIDSEWPARRSAFEAWLNPDNFDATGQQKRDLVALRGGDGA